jgi:uncharacterized protein
LKKSNIYFLGLLTLLVFPIPALWALWFFENIQPWEVLSFLGVLKIETILGLEWGFLYATICLLVFEKLPFENQLKKQTEMLNSLNLNFYDFLFLSFCAGFGEEILFRAGIQNWLGVWLTSFIFVAIHGYLNPKNWKISMYGFLVFPFIISLAYAYDTLGIWFCISAHFSYDLLLFMNLKK